MVHYNDTPNRAKWIYGYYIFLCLAGFSILLGSPGPAVPLPFILDSESCLATPTMGSGLISNCGNGPCHPAEYQAWLGTGHASHVVQINGTHVRIGPDTNVSFIVFDAECAQCHTTGYDSDTGTYDSLNINCHACHKASWDNLSDYSGGFCIDCHNPSSPPSPHPHLAWRSLTHANSLNDLRASSQASTACMSCHATEAFIEYVNPGTLSDFSPEVNQTRNNDGSFPLDGPYNGILCPACHGMHSNWSATSPALIRAANSTALCAICHSGPDQPMYEYWLGSSHQLAGVQCTDCHGYDVPDTGNAFMNHSFAVDPYSACGQSDFCHQGLENYYIGRLEVIQDTYDALTQEILTLADSLEAMVSAYESTEDPNATIIETAETAIDDGRALVAAFDLDQSRGMHNWGVMAPALNDAHRDLMNARAAIIEDESIVPELISGEYEVSTITQVVTVTVTITYDPYEPAGPPPDPELNLVSVTAICLIGSLMIGFIIGRKYLRY